MKLSLVIIYNSFENVPKNGNGAHSDDQCTEQRGFEYRDVTADKMVLLFRKILVLLIIFNNRKI
jgi:hypothetical protein